MALREIIFRGKRQSDGVWEYGFYYAKPILEKHFILTGENQWLVAKESVSQFTGLTDKNGKRIFEGDIVRFAERRIGGEDASIVEQVGFDEGGFCTHRYFLNNWLRNGLYGITKLEGIEVIGNIHDNPELLEAPNA